MRLENCCSMGALPGRVNKQRCRMQRTLGLIVAFVMAFLAPSAATQAASDEQQLRDIQQGLARAAEGPGLRRDGARAGVSVTQADGSLLALP